MNKKIIILSILSLLSLSSLNAGVMDLTLRDGLNGLISTAKNIGYYSKDFIAQNREFCLITGISAASIAPVLLAYLTFSYQDNRRNEEKVEKPDASFKITTVPLHVPIFGGVGKLPVLIVYSTVR